MVEPFFKTIKSELIWPVTWQSRQQAENAVARYIDGFYNPVRRHSSLGFQSPIAFERKAKEVSQTPSTKAAQVQRAGLDPNRITPHTLRHTAVTHLVQSGVDLPTVQRISGHKTLSMVVRYAHQSGSHIEAAMDRLEGRVSGVKTDHVRKMAPKNSA
jgi:site-specific recombinase XerD